jgi:hypothetical protein
MERALVPAEVLAIEPVQVGGHRADRDRGKECREVPCPPEEDNEHAEDDAKADAQKEHARNYPGVREDGVAGRRLRHDRRTVGADENRFLDFFLPLFIPETCFPLVLDVLPVQPDHIQDNGPETEGGKSNRQVPLPPEKPQECGEDEPEADADEQHAGHDFRVGEGSVKGIGVHDYWLLDGRTIKGCGDFMPGQVVYPGSRG